MNPSIRAEIEHAPAREIAAYLHGASRDGTYNRLHKTLRISQADVRWLDVLRSLLGKLGKRSWMYREGARNVWVIETTWRPEPSETIPAPGDATAFVRGYFDADGGVPMDALARFYVQFVQKNHADLSRTRELLRILGIQCGRIHNPSARQDPDYWRFYVLAASHKQFIGTIRSWHPRKRTLLEARANSLSIEAMPREKLSTAWERDPCRSAP